MRSQAVDRRALDVLARQLELCRVATGRPALVLFDADTQPALVDIAVDALEAIGAVAEPVFVDDLLADDHSADPAMPDVVVDLVDGFSDAVETFVSPNARILSVVAQSTGELRDVVPHVGLSRRVKRGLNLLDTGQELHVSDDKGTNLRMGLNCARRWMHDGLASVPGEAAEWPRGLIGSAPTAGTAKGTVVMSPGDIWLPMGWYARSPVILTFEGGRMVSIEGPQSETDAIRAHLSSIGNPSVYRLGAVEIGMLWIDGPRPVALFEPGLAHSPRVGDRYGHVMVATGDYPTFGIACCLRNATVAVDEVAAVRSGQPQGDLAPDVYEQAAHRHPL